MQKSHTCDYANIMGYIEGNKSHMIKFYYGPPALRIPDSYDAKITKKCNLWTFWPVIQLINHLFKIWQKGLFRRCKKCSYILKVASVGGGYFANKKA